MNIAHGVGSYKRNRPQGWAPTPHAIAHGVGSYKLPPLHTMFFCRSLPASDGPVGRHLQVRHMVVVHEHMSELKLPTYRNLSMSELKLPTYRVAVGLGA